MQMLSGTKSQLVSKQEKKKKNHNNSEMLL